MVLPMYVHPNFCLYFSSKTPQYCKIIHYVISFNYAIRSCLKKYGWIINVSRGIWKVGSYFNYKIEKPCSAALSILADALVSPSPVPRLQHPSRPYGQKPRRRMNDSFDYRCQLRIQPDLKLIFQLIFNN